MPDRSRQTHRSDSSVAGSILATSAGVVAGGVATSGPAIAAAGAATGGLGAYGVGLGMTIAAAGCEAAAVGTLLVVATGPVLGGLVGYSTYKVIRTMVIRRKACKAAAEE